MLGSRHTVMLVSLLYVLTSRVEGGVVCMRVVLCVKGGGLEGGQKATRHMMKLEDGCKHLHVALMCWRLSRTQASMRHQCGKVGWCQSGGDGSTLNLGTTQLPHHTQQQSQTCLFASVQGATTSLPTYRQSRRPQTSMAQPRHRWLHRCWPHQTGTGRNQPRVQTPQGLELRRGSGCWRLQAAKVRKSRSKPNVIKQNR